jgi:cob(I)alamin adenosyltransferase
MGSQRVSKHSPVVETLGDLDELNCLIGMMRLHLTGEAKAMAERIQFDLFAAGADLAACGKGAWLEPERTALLEKFMARLAAKTGKPQGFVLPGGTPAAAWCHLARAVCRRTERRASAIHENERPNPEVLRYLNRLSGMLFELAHSLAGRGKEIPGRPVRPAKKPAK